MNNLSISLNNIIEYLKIIPEPFSVDGIVNAFSNNLENEKLVDNFAIYFIKNDECNIWYHSKNYNTKDNKISEIENVINTKLSLKIGSNKIYPLIARNICFGVILIEAKNYILESKRFGFLIDYFALILYTEKLSFQANKDKLTSLYNRGYILKLLYDYQKQNKNYSIIITDLDRFKHYNDKYGHNTGDYILKLASLKMKEALKKVGISTTLARYGGEEFIVLVDTLSKDELKDIMETLRSTIEQTDFSTDDYALRVTMSLGASFSSNDISLTDIIDTADKALYNSKNSGRNKSTIY